MRLEIKTEHFQKLAHLSVTAEFTNLIFRQPENLEWSLKRGLMWYSFLPEDFFQLTIVVWNALRPYFEKLKWR